MNQLGRMFPKFPEAQLPLGEIFLASGDTLKAIQFYHGLANRSPNSPDVRFAAGRAFLMQGQVEAALHEFDVAIGLDPNYKGPYIEAFNVLVMSGQTERALQYLQNWADLHPGDVEMAQRLQAIRQQLGVPGNMVPGVAPPGGTNY
jgi:tetratricopeptide (TPR) repeat protein